MADTDSEQRETNRRLAHSVGFRAAVLALCHPDNVYGRILSDGTGLPRTMSEDEALEAVRAYPLGPPWKRRG